MARWWLGAAVVIVVGFTVLAQFAGSWAWTLMVLAVLAGYAGLIGALRTRRDLLLKRARITGAPAPAPVGVPRRAAGPPGAGEVATGPVPNLGL